MSTLKIYSCSKFLAYSKALLAVLMLYTDFKTYSSWGTETLHPLANILHHHSPLCFCVEMGLETYSEPPRRNMVGCIIFNIYTLKQGLSQRHDVRLMFPKCACQGNSVETSRQSSVSDFPICINSSINSCDLGCDEMEFTEYSERPGSVLLTEPSDNTKLVQESVS